jgi:hypothetical protein
MTDKFKQFLSSLEDYDKPLIESIRNGFSVIYEASNARQFTDRYYPKDNTYELISESPEYIIALIQQSPTMISAIQQNNIQPETITKLELYVADITGEGSGYYGGSKGSWDEPDEGSMFEDGIEVTMSNIMVNIYKSTGEAVEELEIEETTDPEITSTIKQKIEQDDSLNEQLLNDYESGVSDSRAEYQAENREARWQRNLDKY